MSLDFTRGKQTLGLNLKQAITTRHGSKVEIYKCYKDYCNGAWYNEKEDRWIPCTWSMPNGFFLHQKHPRGLDLVNAEYYEPQTA